MLAHFRMIITVKRVVDAVRLGLNKIILHYFQQQLDKLTFAIIGYKKCKIGRHVHAFNLVGIQQSILENNQSTLWMLFCFGLTKFVCL